MITTLYGLQCYNASSIEQVRELKLRGFLRKINGARNVPLVISRTPIKYDALPSSNKILKGNKRGCFSSLLKSFSSKKHHTDVLNGRMLIIQAGYHASPEPENLLKNGLSSTFQSHAFENGNELEGEGLYVAENKETAEGYARISRRKAEVLEVWLCLDSDKINSDDIQKTPAHDIVIRPHVYGNVFFVRSSDK